MSAQAETAPAPIRSILIVEDDPDTLEALRDFFIVHSFVVYTAENGLRALRLLDELRAAPGCILLDLEMPVMNGWQLMARLRDRDCAPPVIILSGGDHADPPSGARHCFTKPPSLDLLLRAAVSCSLRRAMPPR